MEKHLEALKAALDQASADMGETKSFKSNMASFKAASVAFHDFLRTAVEECGGDADYLPDANVLSLDIDHSFTAGETVEDAKVKFVPSHSTMNARIQGIEARA
ncbi:hypothetical protein [Agrobacterium rosae]